MPTTTRRQAELAPPVPRGRPTTYKKQKLSGDDKIIANSLLELMTRRVIAKQDEVLSGSFPNKFMANLITEFQAKSPLIPDISREHVNYHVR